MTRRAVVLVFGFATLANAQAPRLETLIERNDSLAVMKEVRRRPGDARNLLGDLVAQAGRSPQIEADSIFQLSYRLASAYAAVWEDSFPMTNLVRFNRLNPHQRGAKVVADSIRVAGNTAFGSTGVSAAIALWRNAFRRSRAIADTAGMAAAFGNIGSGFYHAGELDSAELYLTRARQLAELIGDRRTAGNAIGTLGSVAKDRGDLRRAQLAYAHALGLRMRIGDVTGASADHNNLGLIAASLGDVTEARKHYTEALRIARDNDLDEAIATALLNLGNLASADGDYAEATKAYGEALTLSRKLANDADAALALHNLGLLALRTGDYRGARDQLRRALALFTRVGTTDDMVQIRRDLASVEAVMGNLHEALTQLRLAEQLLARVPRSHALAAAVALGEADLAIELNNYAEADRQYNRAQSLYRQAGDASGEMEARQGSAGLLIRREQYARAESQLEDVMRAQLTAGDRRSGAITRLMLAHAHERRGDNASARRLIGQGLETLHSLGDAVGEAAALLALADLELESRSPLAAESQYRKGLALIKTRNAPAVLWQLHSGLGEALRNRGAPTEAAAELRLAIGEVERLGLSLSRPDRRSIFLVDKWEPYAQLALMEREHGDNAAAFAVSERMRAGQMLDLFSRGAVMRPVTADSGLLVREQNLRRRVAELTQRLESTASTGALRGPDLTDRSSGVTREALSSAQDEYAQVLLELDDRAAAGRMTRRDIMGWRTVAASLARDQALLEYLVTDTTTLVFVVKADTIQIFDLGVGKKALVSLVDFARGTLGRPNGAASASAWRPALRRLYAQLVAPVEESGLLDNVHQLVIVPHAELHYLPFSALLRRRDRDEFLVERYDIAYAPSASLWVRLGQRGSSSSERILALAPRASVLAGSRAEVEAIRSLYGVNATVLSDGAATEDAFRARAADFGVVHLATYGVLNQHNPLFSFVDLSGDGENDGRLEVHEVFGLTLHARLLVLSACQTALASGAVSDVPAGDDWVGLVRAFLGAGAENVIATLWAVEDRSTAGVMERLHRRLRAGDSEVAALSQAQRETLRNPATSGPFFWAGFVLVGGGGR